MNLKLGAHMSISGGLHQSLDRIKAIGGNCLQIFSSSPRGWAQTKVTDADKKLFINKKKQLQIDPVYFHASYLVNLADDERIGQASKNSLITEMNLASQLGIQGSIIHLGSYKNHDLNMFDDVSTNKKFGIFINNILEILTKTPKDRYFIIESAGNRKIGQNIDEIATIIKVLNDERVKVCLDTCHLFSAGYSLQSEKELDSFLSDFDKKIGLNKLDLWHLNDSRDAFNAMRDRHENIGAGTIGLNTFKLLLNYPKTKDMPFIIETPGFDKKGPDKKNLDILKSLINK